MRNVLSEIAIILQVLVAKKSQCAKKMLYQIHILDIIASNLILQNAYIANTLVNFWGLSHIFYEINLLLKYQNGEFKCFWTNWDSFLRKVDDILKLHILLIDTLLKVRWAINKVIIRQEHSKRHLTKSTLFDI